MVDWMGNTLAFKSCDIWFTYDWSCAISFFITYTLLWYERTRIRYRRKRPNQMEVLR